MASRRVWLAIVVANALCSITRGSVVGDGDAHTHAHTTTTAGARQFLSNQVVLNDHPIEDPSERKLRLRQSRVNRRRRKKRAGALHGEGEEEDEVTADVDADAEDRHKHNPEEIESDILDEWIFDEEGGSFSIPPTSKPTLRPVTKVPTASMRPATQKPATQKPATQKPATQKPATQRPATQKPSTAPPPTPSTTPPTPIPAPIPTVRPTPVPTKPIPNITLIPVTRPPTVAPSEPALPSVFELIQEGSQFSVFEEAIVAAGQQEDFDTLDPLTAFGPTDSAFDEFGLDYTNLLITDPDFGLHLNGLVLNQATTDGSFLAADLVEGLEFNLRSGERCTVINNATGIFLRTFAASLGFTAAVEVVREEEQSGNNGVLQEVAEVVAPAWFFLNLIDLLEILGSEFSTFLELIEAADLADTIATTPNTTLLAPTNDAFEALNPDVLALLTDPDNVDVLRDVLLYHFITSQVINFDILPSGDTTFEAAQGDDVVFRIEEDGTKEVFINDNKSPTFFLTELSLMYQLDGVLLPPSFNAPTASPTTAPEETLLRVISQNDDYNTFQVTIFAAGLDVLLDDPNAISTVYAPINEAFDALEPAYLASLLTPPYNLQLVDLMSSQILPDQELFTADMFSGQVLVMLNELEVTVSRNAPGVFPEIQLITPSAEAGETPIVNITLVFDVDATNGVLQEVDSLIFPEWYFYQDPYTVILSAPAGTFDFLTAIIAALNLEDTLADLRDVTFFAPNNEAFAALPSETRDFLQQPENFDVMQEILEYHILERMVPFTELRRGDTTAATLQGEVVILNKSGPNLSDVTVNDIDIVELYLGRSSIVYEISGVLIPPSLLPEIPGLNRRGLSVDPVIVVPASAVVGQHHHHHQHVLG